jgi:hypothetical protein
MSKPPNSGVLYIAAGEKYIRAAIHSARSVRKYCPELPIHLFADWQNYAFRFDQSPDPFTSINTIQNPHRRSKVDYLAQSPYEKTLYLDSDTALNANISDMFMILDRFDIAMCHAHWRRSSVTTRTWQKELPEAFPQFNTGVILYKRSIKTLDFFQAWRDNFIAAGLPQDQITLRETLYLSELRIATLPPEYNVRFLKYHLLWSKSEAQTKIFHLQMYHDGPFWFFKNWSKIIGRKILSWFGSNPGDLKRKIKK